MGLFDRWFGAGVTDPTVAARQRSAAWGAFLASQRATLPPRPVDGVAPLATAPTVARAGGMAPVRSPMAASPAPVMSSPSSRTTTPTTTVRVIEDGEEVV